MEVTIACSGDRFPAGGTYPIVIKLRIAQGWYIHGTRKSEGFIIPTVLSFEKSSGVRVADLRFPEPEERSFEYADMPMAVFSGEIRVRGRIVIEKTAPPGKRVVEGRLSFQACSSNSCLPPETIPVRLEIRVVPPASGGASVSPAAAPGAGFSGSGGGASGREGGAGLLLTLVGIFVGGLALNLTPCVYPLIPITVSYFGGRSRRRGDLAVAHGAVYVLGLSVTNSLLGLGAGLSGGMLGSVLRNPLVLIFVAMVLVSLGLSFFGAWELRLPAFLMRAASKSYTGYAGTFFMGLTLGIVAAPCLGPFILGLLTYVGQKGDPFLGFLCFFVLSLGLGLPLAVLAVFSGALERLPASGAWMVWVRKLLGWVLFGMAAYLLRPLIPGDMEKSAVMAAVLAAAALHLGWLDRTAGPSRLFPLARKGAGLMLAAGAVFVLVTAHPGEKGLRWTPYTPSLAARAATEKRPVIIDFYADWCRPCVEMDREVFTDPRIVALSGRFLALRVDLTRKGPGQDRLLKRFHVRGVPTLIFLNAEGVERRDMRIESYVKRDEVLRRLRSLAGPFDLHPIDKKKGSQSVPLKNRNKRL